VVALAGGIIERRVRDNERGVGSSFQKLRTKNFCYSCALKGKTVIPYHLIGKYYVA